MLQVVHHVPMERIQQKVLQIAQNVLLVVMDIVTKQRDYAILVNLVMDIPVEHVLSVTMENIPLEELLPV